LIRISEATKYDYEKDEIRRAVTYERGPLGFMNNGTLGDHVDVNGSRIGLNATMIEGSAVLNCMSASLYEAEDLAGLLSMAFLAFRQQFVDRFNRFHDITPIAIGSTTSIIHSGGADDLVHVPVSLRYQLSIGWLADATRQAIHNKTIIDLQNGIRTLS